MNKLNNLATFLKYNNFVPVALAILILGGGGAFAATPAGQQAVLNTTNAVASVDNSFIRTVDLDTYPFAIRVTKVEEDDQNYYLTYELDTITLEEGMWQPATLLNTMTVRKTAFVGDLGLYAEGELAQLLDRERVRLLETQQIELSIGETNKTIATVYTGLVGQFLEDTMTEFEDYDPTVATPEPINPSPATIVSPSFDENDVPEPQDTPEEPQPTDEEPTDEPPQEPTEPTEPTEPPATTTDPIDTTILDETVNPPEDQTPPQPEPQPEPTPEEPPAEEPEPTEEPGI